MVLRLESQHHLGALMKARLGSLLFLATLVIPSKAECIIENQERLPNQKYDECMDADGGKHFLNSTWKKEKCTWCFCSKTSITCCTNTAKPVDYDEEKCSKQFHPENCTYSVVERTNPGKTCRVNRWTV
uniref:beta-microseminoprotein n=1 Tax=Arvicanthis niloticus TaxID=61156 RepID=UPI0014869856|nr:beta-microseminoprotein [Arvicanthis niloticus]